MSTLIVQKYGGSVLRDDDAVRAVAAEVARAVACGSVVVAVVSALASVTDRHLERATRLCAARNGPAIDLLVATGEIESASLLALALAEIGVAAEALNPWQIGLHTDDAAGGARIVRINPLPLLTRLTTARVVVVPGFVGRANGDRLTTLGRGGSDLTAIAIADTLGVERCEFFKDVAGYFSADPALVPHAHHRPEVAIDEALELSRSGCRFLQDRAIEWASAAACAISIRALGDARSTAIVADRRSGGPLLAVTHDADCDRDVGLVSLVGESRAIRRPATARAAVRALGAANVAGRVVAVTDRRLTIEVPRDRLPEAHRVIHDQFFPDAAIPGRATPPRSLTHAL